MSLLRAVTQVGPELGPPLQQQLVPLQQLQKWLSSQTFFFFLISIVNIHLWMDVLLVSWKMNMKQSRLSKLLQDKFLNNPNFRGRNK